MSYSSFLPQHEKACEAAAALCNHTPSLRQERLSGIHNPWGQGAGYTNPWIFLDLCENEAIIAAAQVQFGCDILLWDSELYLQAADYAHFLEARGEGRYWPLVPLAGGVVLVPLHDADKRIHAVGLDCLTPQTIHIFSADQPLYVIRLAPASSHFERNPRHHAHRLCMEEQVLMNYAERPLWLLSGQDHGDNDFVGGFSPLTPQWAQQSAL